MAQEPTHAASEKVSEAIKADCIKRLKAFFNPRRDLDYDGYVKEHSFARSSFSLAVYYLGLRDGDFKRVVSIDDAEEYGTYIVNILAWLVEHGFLKPVYAHREMFRLTHMGEREVTGAVRH